MSTKKNSNIQTKQILTFDFCIYHVTWKYVRHIPASHPIQTPVLANRSSEHREQTFAPHLLYGISKSVTLERRSTSPNATPGTYKAHTKCTHFPTSVSLNIPPELGHNSQTGFVTPALQASQNHGAVGDNESVLVRLPLSDTP